MAFKVFCFLLIVGCAFAEVKRPTPCAVEDLACFNKARQELNDQSYAGIPKYGLKAFDPLVIPTFEFFKDDVKVIFSDLKITGFKNSEVTSLARDRDAKTFTVSSKYNLNIDDSDLEVDFVEEKKKFTGKFLASTGVTVTSIYNYELKADEKGQNHIKILSQNFKCDLFDVNVTKDEKLEEAIINDPVLSKDLYNKEEREAFDKELLCKIIIKGYETIASNYKITAEHYPVTAFFTNF